MSISPPSHQQPTNLTAEPTAGTHKWLTASEAAAYLRVETRTILAWVRQGKVKGYSLSGTRRHAWRFLAADLDVILSAPSVCPERMLQ